MAYWLMKSEPGTWSWEDQVGAGAKGTAWDGVRNHLAKIEQMQKMKKGDRAFFYHSGDEKSVVGILEIIGEHRPDPSDKTANSSSSTSKRSRRCRRR
jgi:predicted RNA-binding protein with PUA-like domain